MDKTRRNLKTPLTHLLQLIQAKYEDACLILFEDESGRLVDGRYAAQPYNQKALYNFRDLDDLFAHLRSK